MSDSYAAFQDGDAGTDVHVIIRSDKKKQALTVLDTLVIVLSVILLIFGASTLLVGVLKLKNFSTKDKSRQVIIVSRVLWGSMAGGGIAAIVSSLFGGLTVALYHKRILLLRQIAAIGMIIAMISLAILNTISIIIRGVQLFQEKTQSGKVKGIIWFSAGFGFVGLYEGGLILLLIVRFFLNRKWKK